MGKAYYNEIEPYAAQWLRNLINKGLIAPGDVDTRSIEDVRPEELKQYTQCHFFAGIGIWSLALRNAGVSDDTRIWTGSCPCQPFSSAGKANGFDDERHLWPAFQHLISECRPPAVLGEQVASKDADPWIDLVQNDLEAMGYAVGAVPFPSASVGAPHIRDRLYWVGERVADPAGIRFDRWRAAETVAVQGHGTERGGQYQEPGVDGELPRGSEGLCRHGRRVSDPDPQRLDPRAGTGLCQDAKHDTQSCCGVVGMADTGCQRRQQVAGSAPYHEATDGGAGRQQRQSHGNHQPAGDGEVCGIGLGHAISTGLEGHPGHEHDRCGSGRIVTPEDRSVAAPGCTNGFWRDCDWLPFRDGKIRPIEPSTSPLVDGNPTVVGRLRAYGNAINAVQAEEFIRAWLACRPE